MTNAKKILITTESHERFVVRRRIAKFPQHVCPFCLTLACGLTLDDAKAYSGLSVLELVRTIDTAAIRAYEIESGPLLICQKSLEIFCAGEK
jgi:hypothetical protein